MEEIQSIKFPKPNIKHIVIILVILLLISNGYYLFKKFERRAFNKGAEVGRNELTET